MKFFNAVETMTYKGVFIRKKMFLKYFAAFLSVMLLVLSGCMSFTKVPWDFFDNSKTILEGYWYEEDMKFRNYVFGFLGNSYVQSYIGVQGNVVPFLRGYFRIRDGNLETIMMSYNKNLLDGLSYDAKPLWIDMTHFDDDVEYYRNYAPTKIYSMDLQGDTLTLTEIGGRSYDKNEPHRKIVLKRMKRSI